MLLEIYEGNFSLQSIYIKKGKEREREMLIKYFSLKKSMMIRELNYNIVYDDRK